MEQTGKPLEYKEIGLDLKKEQKEFEESLINMGDYCSIKTGRFKEFGVLKKDVVYVVGHKALPVSRTDPYSQRIKFLVNLINKETKKVISGQIYFMDPRSLKKVVKEVQKSYENINKPTMVKRSG